jgi:hypothetical protein
MHDINHLTPCDFRSQETIGAVPPQENLGSLHAVMSNTQLSHTVVSDTGIFR